MKNRLFAISGHKVSTLLLTDDAIRMSSGQFLSVEEFENAWEKKLTLRTKLQISYDSIRSITKEHQETKFLITYRTYAGFPSESEFSFLAADDYATFYRFPGERTLLRQNRRSHAAIQCRLPPSDWIAAGGPADCRGRLCRNGRPRGTLRRCKGSGL
ncbi:hypothetical protein ACQ86N_00510 [Puia sp. P3]|uniref:hypothetical protein n=1 Tax=Puia sp. P3 TaxID=3423952 RepID=UPI003D6725F0